MRWVLIALAAYVVLDLICAGRVTSAAVGAVSGSVKDGLSARRAETDRILSETEGGRRKLAKRVVRRRKRSAFLSGAKAGVRSGAVRGLEARDRWQVRAGHTVRVGGHAVRTWKDKKNPGAWIGLGSAILDTFPDTPKPDTDDDDDLACPTCEDRGTVPWDDTSDVLCPDCPTPAPSNTVKREAVMSTATSEVGAAEYLSTLRSVTGRIEQVLSDVQDIARTLTNLSENAADYDAGSGADTAAMLAAASDDLAAAAEAVEGWSSEATREHAAAVEAAEGSSSKALRDYAGAQ